MASGATLGVFGPQMNQPPTAAFATIDVRNAIPVLDFDDTTDEEAVFGGVLPSNYSGGGLTFKLHFMATSATSGNGVWQAAIERMNTDEDADSFAAFKSSGAVTVDGTSGIITVATITMTSGAEMDSLAAGEAFRLKIRRDADNTSATDSVTGDLELVRVEVQET